MLRKDHEQPFSPSRVPWQHRRLQRSVAIAFFILTLLVFALYRQQKIPIVTELHLDTITGLHRYGSAPEAGRPSLPFNDDAHRKTDPEPFFEMPDNDDSDGEEDAESLEEPTTQLPEIPVIPGEAFASTDKPALPTQETTDEASVEFKEGPKAQDTMSTTRVQKKPISPELVALDPTKVALLLETRPLPHLPALLSHFISVLPLPWTFYFVGSPASISLIERSAALRNHIKTGKLILTDLPKKYPINSQEAISTTLVDISFYQEFLAPAEWLLVFQSDSIICSGFDGSIEDYVSKGYTWVGAPWNLANEFGGNGGLSLRHVPPIIKVLETEKRKAGSDWEDRWLCDRLGKMDASNMPAPEIERHFSVEGIWTDRPFGYHLRGSGKYLEDDIWGDPNRRKAIYEYCPEIKIVLDMDLNTEIVNMRKELAAVKKEMINKSAKILGISNKEVLEKAVENATAQAAKDAANETAGNVAAERIHG